MSLKANGLAVVIVAWSLGLLCRAEVPAMATVAGNGTSEFLLDDGVLAIDASIAPAGVAVDASGNIYIADYGNNRIRKIDPSSNFISTIAGNGIPAFSGDNGPASAAMLFHPRDLALDAAGNLFVACDGDNHIRRIDSLTGVITTIAGIGYPLETGDGGPAMSAGLICNSLCIDSNGNIFVAGGNRIRKIAAGTQIITTVAGTGKPGFGGDGGPATTALFFGTVAVRADAKGNLFIVDRGNNRIRKVDMQSGLASTFAGGGTNGFHDLLPPTSTDLIGPNGLAIAPDGNVFISELGRQLIRKVDASNNVIHTLAGAGLDGDGSTSFRAEIIEPVNLFFSAPQTALFIAGGGRIRKSSLIPATDTEDTDNDGFPDVVEIAAGTSPTDPTSRPFGGKRIRRADIFNLLAAVAVSGPGKDKIKLSGALFTTNAFLVSQSVILEIGPIVRVFTLDTKGKSTQKSPDSLAFKLPTSTPANVDIPFTLQLTKGDFSALLTAPAGKSGFQSLALNMLIQTAAFSGSVDVAVKVSINKSQTASSSKSTVRPESTSPLDGIAVNYPLENEDSSSTNQQSP